MSQDSEKKDYYKDFERLKEKAFKYSDVTEIHYSPVGAHVVFVDSASPTSGETVRELVMNFKDEFPNAWFFSREKGVYKDR